MYEGNCKIMSVQTLLKPKMINNEIISFGHSIPLLQFVYFFYSKTFTSIFHFHLFPSWTKSQKISLKNKILYMFLNHLITQESRNS